MLDYRNELANRESEMRRAIGLMFLGVLLLCPERVWALANPASVFCAQSGGKSEIRKGPRGQYAVYAISDGSDQPYRLRIHDPSFVNLQSVGLMMPGNLIADTMAVMASLDPIMGGVDK